MTVPSKASYSAKNAANFERLIYTRTRVPARVLTRFGLRYTALRVATFREPCDPRHTRKGFP